MAEETSSKQTAEQQSTIEGPKSAEFTYTFSSSERGAIIASLLTVRRHTKNELIQHLTQQALAKMDALDVPADLGPDVIAKVKKEKINDDAS